MADEKVTLKSSTKETNTNKNGKASFTVRESYSNDTSRSITVEEVENGFIVRVEKSYYDKNKNYKWEEKKYISKTNPLEKKVSKQMMSTDTEEIIGSIDSYIKSVTNKISV